MVDVALSIAGQATVYTLHRKGAEPYETRKHQAFAFSFYRLPRH